MPEPDEIRIACIGCGAMNPVGAEVCAGCGHRFAGPAGGRIPPSSTGSVPEIDEPRVSLSPSRPNTELTLLGCLARAIGMTMAVIATFIAFGVAFFVTCLSTNGNAQVPLSFIAGLAAAAVVAVCLQRLGRFGRK